MTFVEAYGNYEELKASLSKIQTQATSLDNEYKEAQAHFRYLNERLKQESYDVEVLKKTNISNGVKKIFGSYKKEFAKEYQEYISIKSKYDNEKYLIDSLIKTKDKLSHRVTKLNKQIQEAKEELKQYPEYQDINKHIQYQRDQVMLKIKEITEAMTACDKAVIAAKKALDAFKNASALSGVNLGFGDFLVDGLRYGQFDYANKLVQELSFATNNLERELKDCEPFYNQAYKDFKAINSNFSDFFENIFVEYEAKNRIQKNRSILNNYINKVKKIHKMLTEQNYAEHDKLNSLNFD